MYVQMSYFSFMRIKGVEWDGGNWPKCGNHGVSQSEIEYVLKHSTIRVRDPNPDEERFRTAGQTSEGRHVFVVYTYREYKSDVFIRPISARYMHEKEVKNYEQR